MEWTYLLGVYVHKFTEISLSLPHDQSGNTMTHVAVCENDPKREIETPIIYTSQGETVCCAA